MLPSKFPDFFQINTGMHDDTKHLTILRPAYSNHQANRSCTLISIECRTTTFSIVSTETFHAWQSRTVYRVQSDKHQRTRQKQTQILTDASMVYLDSSNVGISHLPISHSRRRYRCCQSISQQLLNSFVSCHFKCSLTSLSRDTSQTIKNHRKN